LRQIHTEGTAARDTWLAARELHALAKLLQQQAFDLSLAAQQPGVRRGHAGDAPALAHEARKLVERTYLERPGSAWQAEAMVEKAIAAKVRWIIESKAGVVHGTYVGASEKEAFMAMLDESGDAGAYGEAHVGTEADWIIKPAQE